MKPGKIFGVSSPFIVNNKLPARKSKLSLVCFSQVKILGLEEKNFLKLPSFVQIILMEEASLMREFDDFDFQKIMN